VYTLPSRVSGRLPLVRPACYFCYIRMTGIKPTRSRIALIADGADGARAC
jgi:hypothetical protein